MSFFDEYTTMTFTLSLSSITDFGVEPLECKSASKCKITYRRDYTPVVFYINPPVVYYDAVTEFWFDPRYTNRLIENLDSDEMYFINAKIGGSLLDFEFIVDDETTFSSYAKNRAKGRVGELPIGESYDLTM